MKEVGSTVNGVSGQVKPPREVGKPPKRRQAFFCTMQEKLVKIIGNRFLTASRTHTRLEKLPRPECLSNYFRKGVIHPDRVCFASMRWTKQLCIFTEELILNKQLTKLYCMTTKDEA